MCKNQCSACLKTYPLRNKRICLDFQIEAAEAEEDAKRDDPCDLEKLNNELYQLSKKVGNNDPAVVDKRKKKAKKGRATRATKRAQGIYGEENRRIRRVIEEGQPLIAKKVRDGHFCLGPNTVTVKCSFATT